MELSESDGAVPHWCVNAISNQVPADSPVRLLSDVADDAPLSELVKATRQRDALYRLGERLHRAGDAADVYDASLDAIESALDCDRSSILLFDDQQHRHCRIRATPIRHEDGTVREWVGACTDIDPHRAIR